MRSRSSVWDGFMRERRCIAVAMLTALKLSSSAQLRMRMFEANKAGNNPLVQGEVVDPERGGLCREDEGSTCSELCVVCAAPSFEKVARVKARVLPSQPKVDASRMCRQHPSQRPQSSRNTVCVDGSSVITGGNLPSNSLTSSNLPVNCEVNFQGGLEARMQLSADARMLSAARGLPL